MAGCAPQAVHKQGHRAGRTSLPTTSGLRCNLWVNWLTSRFTYCRAMRFPIDANLLRAAIVVCQEFGHQVDDVAYFVRSGHAEDYGIIQSDVVAAPISAMA